MTVLLASARLVAALVLIKLISIDAAVAQTVEQRVAGQSTNQIVGAKTPKMVEQEPLPKQEQAAPQPVVNAMANAIIPPPPVVIMRSSNAISIPADELQPEARYEERPVISSNARVGSLFGYRIDPFTRRAKFHSGVDIKARSGDLVAASRAGTVQFAGWYHGYGNLVIIAHGSGITTHYAHLSGFDVVVGDKVERGVIVGRAGSTGRATSPHLHYEVRIDGNPINPFQTIALDPSSEYFKQAEPARDASKRDEAAEATRPRRVN